MESYYAKHADLALLEKPVVKKHKKASDYKGLLSSELTEALKQYVQQSREEQWA